MSDSIKHTLNTRDAKLLIRKAHVGSYFYACCSVQLPTPTSEEDKARGITRGFPGYTSVKISRKASLRLVADLLKDFEERGARINIRIIDKSFFIG